MKIHGTVASGLGHGAQFLAVPWVRRQLQDALGLVPYPGTLNLRVSREAREQFFAQRHNFLRIADAATPDCPGYLTKVTLRANDLVCDAHLILPEKTDYDDVLEMISAECLRDALRLTDGDAVVIDVA
jgi:riboflavin kinase, archaea type